MQNSIAKTKTSLLLLLMAVLTVPALAQNVLKGKVIDSSENKKLQHSIVALIDLSDTTLYRSWRTGVDGSFELKGIPAGKYSLMISYPKMADYLQDLQITDTSIIDLGNLSMLSEAKLMQEVVVTAGRAMRMRGDTLEYTADSFAVKPGANVQALLKRLPGIEVTRSGQILSQGQEVKKMLVDGDEFFTDDPKFAAQFLRANAIDKVQVYDKKSEESVLTGFDDGKKTKTINLKLKDDAKNGYFGIAKTGGNGEGNYEHELMAAVFSKGIKAGVFGIAAKSMSRDFSADVLSKASGESTGEYIEDGTSGMVMKQSQGASLGQYSGSGLPSILNGGAHFSNKWNGGKSNFGGNYRVRSHEGNGWNNSTNYTFTNDTMAFLNKNEQAERSSGIGHNASGLLGVKLDTFTQMKVSVNGSNGEKDADRNRSSSSRNYKDIMVNNSQTRENERRNDKEFQTSVNINRKLPKLNGNINLTLEQEYSNAISDNQLQTTNNFFNNLNGVPDSTEVLDRMQASRDNYQSYGARVAFTGKFSRNWSSQMEYGIKTRMSENQFNTLNGANGKYDQRVDSLSNHYDLTTLTQIAGAGVSYTTKKFSINSGAKAFLTGLNQLDIDLGERRKRTFTNIAPYFRTSYMIRTFSTISFDYSGATLQPSLQQLQPLRKSSDQLNVQEGNPDLVPGFSHRVGLSYFGGNMKKELMLNLNVSGSLSSNEITNATTVDGNNRQVSRFVNVDGLPSFSAMLNLNKGWRSKGINLSGGVNYSRNGRYTIMNNEKLKSMTNSWNFNGGVSYNLKEFLSADYRAGVSFSDGTTHQNKQEIKTKNFTHNHSIGLSVSLPGKFEIKTDMRGSFNPGTGSFSNNVDVITWDATLEKKFLANEGLVLKATINDILNKNTGYNRSINGANWSENNGFVLRRYMMLSLTWNFGSSF